MRVLIICCLFLGEEPKQSINNCITSWTPSESTKIHHGRSKGPCRTHREGNKDIKGQGLGHKANWQLWLYTWESPLARQRVNQRTSAEPILAIGGLHSYQWFTSSKGSYLDSALQIYIWEGTHIVSPSTSQSTGCGWQNFEKGVAVRICTNPSVYSFTYPATLKKRLLL